MNPSLNQNNLIEIAVEDPGIHKEEFNYEYKC